MKGIFKCSGDSYETLPSEVRESAGIIFPDAHCSRDQMIKLAKAFQVHRLDAFVRLPFCVTLEAEALGAKINLGDEVHGPRVQTYHIQSPEDIDKVISTQAHTLSPRQETVLESVRQLAPDVDVILCVTGPITIATSLMEPRLFYKLLRKDKEKIQGLLEHIENHIQYFAQAGIRAGAQIISYADPVGGLDIVGPMVFRDISGPASRRVLSKIAADMEMGVLHICAKTTVGMEHIGLCSAHKIEQDSVKYTNLIKTLASKSQLNIVGHCCLKGSGLDSTEDVQGDDKIQSLTYYRIELT